MPGKDKINKSVTDVNQKPTTDFVVEDDNAGFLAENTTAVNDNGSVKTIGVAITEKGIEQAQTPSEVRQAIEVGDYAQRDADANRNLLDATSESKFPKVKALDDVIQFRMGGVGSTPTNVPTYSSVAPALGGIVKSDPEEKKPIVTNLDLMGLTPEEKELYTAMAKNYIAPKTSSASTLERLYVSDYYPDLNQDISAGTISSQMLGTRQRWVARGGIIPDTVIDARQKALAKQAQEAQQKQDEIKKTQFVTAQQYQQAFDDVSNDMLFEYFDMAGNDLTVLTDPTTKLGQSFLKTTRRLENAYKSVAEVDKTVKDALSDQNKNNKYIPETQLKLMEKWNSGKMLTLQDMLAKDINPHTFQATIKVFQNSRKLMDEKLKDMESEGDVIPLNMDVDWSDPKMALNAKEAVKRKAGQSHDQYLSASRTYFDLSRLETVVDGILSNDDVYRGADAKEQEDIHSDMISYMASSLADKINFKQDVLSHNRASEALARDKFNWDKHVKGKEWEQGISFFETQDQNVSGVAATNAYVAIFNDPNLTPEQKRARLNDLMLKTQNYNNALSQRTGFTTSEVLVSDEQKNQIQYTSHSAINIGSWKANAPTRTMADYGKMLRGEITVPKEELAHWKKVVDGIYQDTKGTGQVGYYVNQMGVAPATPTYDAKTGKTTYNPAQFMNIDGVIKGNTQVQTMGMDFFTSYVVPEEAEVEEGGKKVMKPTGKTIVKNSPRQMYTAYNLSDENVKARKDAIDKGQGSKQLEQGELQRTGGGVKREYEGTSNSGE